MPQYHRAYLRAFPTMFFQRRNCFPKVATGVNRARWSVRVSGRPRPGFAAWRSAGRSVFEPRRPAQGCVMRGRCIEPDRDPCRGSWPFVGADEAGLSMIGILVAIGKLATFAMADRAGDSVFHQAGRTASACGFRHDCCQK